MLNTIMLMFCALLAPACLMAGQSVGQQEVKSVVITKSGKAGVGYRFGTRVLKYSEIFSYVSENSNDASRNDRFWVIFHSDVPFSAVVEMRKILEVIGFSQIKYYTFEEAGYKMMQIEMKGVIPYSTSPSD